MDDPKVDGHDGSERSTVRNVVLPSMLGRAPGLLSAFRPEAGVSAAELVRSTGTAKPTAHQLLGELVDLRVIERTGRRYRLGLRMFGAGPARVTRA